MDVVVRGGTVVTAGGSFQADVGIADGRIAELGTVGGDAPAIDATGLFVLPGGVDVHTHLRLPAPETPDRLFQDTVAAACGGTTTVLTFIEMPRGGSILQTLETWSAGAAPQAAVDYGFHVILKEFTPRVAAEIPQAIAAGCPTFKGFMVYDDLRIDDADLLRAFRLTAEHAGMMMVHCENRTLLEDGIARHVAAGETVPKFHALSRPPLVEAEATYRAICLARAAQAPLYIVHLSCREALRHVREAKAHGRAVFAETCPHYLTLSEERYDAPEDEAARFIISPPLRTRAQHEHLWNALAAGQLDCVGSDHVPRSRAGERAKNLTSFVDIPNGAPGIETRVPLVYDPGVTGGELSLERFVDVVATAPAALFGLERKGAIEVGRDADLVIWNPDQEWEIHQERLHHSADFTPYEGRRVRGAPTRVFLRGQEIVTDGQFVGRRGAGEFQKRKLSIHG
ncbi:MAG TPA: dihydropyrimidinase [Candidatus Eisenbacteria bacterium]|jgi:dihydropyrimidinase|nr:dihydropyrimidinase [Candidatus Eisenbacteria bacterium]